MMVNRMLSLAHRSIAYRESKSRLRFRRFPVSIL